MSKKNSNVILKEILNNQEELSNIYNIFKNKLIFYNSKKYLVAVSGGPDSLALVALAKLFNYETKCKIYYVLIDHNLRKNSSTEANSVKRLLKKNKINLLIIKNKKKKIDKNIQSQARKMRYDFLVSFCKKREINTILTAHNLEDQVETFFIRLSRGSGLHGLSSMREITKVDNKVSILRPLLDIKKNQLIKISKTVFGKFFQDPSNNNKKFLRSKIRKLKVPLEKSGVDYNQIIKSIKNLASSRDTLDLHFEQVYKNISTKKKKFISLNLKKFNYLNKEMRMRVLGRSVKDISKSYYSPRYQKIINLNTNLDNKKNVKYLLAGCVIFKEKNQIIVKKVKKGKII